jgi:hypothetical protein
MSNIKYLIFIKTKISIIVVRTRTRIKADPIISFVFILLFSFMKKINNPRFFFIKSHLSLVPTLFCLKTTNLTQLIWLVSLLLLAYHKRYFFHNKISSYEVSQTILFRSCQRKLFSFNLKKKSFLFDKEKWIRMIVLLDLL